MRLFLLVVAGSVATSAMAAQGNNFAPGAGEARTLATAQGYWMYSGGLAYTPTMRRADEDRRANGLAYIAANARTVEDVKELAQNCRKGTAVPDYCALPEMRQIARLDR